MSARPDQQLDASNPPDLARGCSLLGAGGGGDTELGLQMALQAVEEHGPVELVALGDLPADACVMPCGLAGSPAVSEERIWSGDEGGELRAVVERLDGGVAALMCCGIAGASGLLPVTWAARTGLPLADADGMGRAFPRLEQQAMRIASVPASPVVLSDGRGGTVVIEEADDARAGAACARGRGELRGPLRGRALLHDGGRAREAAIGGSVSCGRDRPGGGGRRAPIGALCDELEAVVLIEGKVVDVQRGTGDDAVGGSVTVQADPGRRMRPSRLELQNEYLLALEDGALASVPDVICVLSADTAEPVPTDRIRIGEQVVVTAWAGPAIWRTDRGLPVARPGGVRLRHRLCGTGHDAAELRLGVDVGTVSTDAVLMDANDRLLAKCRLPGRERRGGGARRDRGDGRGGRADPARVTRAMVGAARDGGPAERRLFDRVGVIRIGAPLTRALPPPLWGGRRTCVAPCPRARSSGGCAEHDGHSAQPLDAEAVARFVASVAGELDVAITGVFSPVAADQEPRPARWCGVSSATGCPFR